jgi:hypothetical protein
MTAMAEKTTAIKDEYTRKVSGETFQYEVEYSSGETVAWSARVYQDGILKGEPNGSIIDNAFTGEALKVYIVSYMEGIIERGLGIAE